MRAERGTRLLIGVLLAAVPLAGCGTQGGSPGPAASATAEPEPSASPDPSVTLPADYLGLSELPHGAALPPGPPADGYLQGAGWSLLPSGLDAGPAVRTYAPVFDAKTGAQTIGNYLIGYAVMRPAPGQEVLVAELSGTRTPSSAAAGQDRPAHPLTIRAGGTVHRLTLDKNARVVVGVPAGAPVTLTVEDARPQSIDLRTGKRVGTPPDLALFYAPPKQAKTAGPTCGFVKDNAGWAVLSELTATLVPGVAGHGYAPAGRAWLVASVTLTTYERMTVRLDRASFRLTAGGATLQPKPVGELKTYPVTGAPMVHQGGTTVVFDVPATLRTAALRVMPTGRYVVDGVERPTRTYGCTPDAPVPLTLA